MNKSSNDFFWPSYVDLLTALFVVVLILFVLSFKLLSDSKKITEDELNRIKEIQKISEQLPKSLFEFQSEFKRWTLKRQIEFQINSDVIPKSDFDYLLEVGDSLKVMIDVLKKRFTNENLKYLIIIEGMSSKIGTNPDPNNLSYRRALALLNFWRNKGIEFDSTVCETIISGSGINGIGRYPYDPPLYEQEKKNQRILLQIIPKTSKS